MGHEHHAVKPNPIDITWSRSLSFFAQEISRSGPVNPGDQNAPECSRDFRQHLFHRRHWIGRSTQPTLRWKSCISSFIRRDGGGRREVPRDGVKMCEMCAWVKVAPTCCGHQSKFSRSKTCQKYPEMRLRMVPTCSNLRIWSAWNQSRFTVTPMPRTQILHANPTFLPWSRTWDGRRNRRWRNLTENRPFNLDG